MQIIVVGCGKVGRALISQLSKEDNNVTVVDTDPSRVHAVSTLYDVMGIVGNGTSFKVLDEAGIADADMMIAVTDSDEVNLLCCVIAKKAVKCHTIARVRNPVYSREREFLRSELGLSMIVNPEFEAAREVAYLFRYPEAIEVDRFAKGRADLLRFRVPDGTPLDGTALRDLPKAMQDILVCMAERDGETLIPDGDFKIRSGDVLSIITVPGKCRPFFEKLGTKTRRIRSALLIGGGKVTLYLAQMLLESGIDVKIIERRHERCEELAELLPNATIVCGNGSDHDLLKEEHIETMDAMLASTSMDEENIILSLYARNKIHYKVVTQLSHLDVSSVIRGLDLDSIVSPKNVTAEAIVRFVRATANGMGSNVETLFKLKGGAAEALEFYIQPDSPVTGQTLRDMKLKSNLLIAGIVRDGRLIIPGGQDEIRAGDSVIVVTTNIGYTDVRDILA